MKKAIAMKCNQEQFEAIKPKLKGMEVECISNFDEWNYLVNNEDGNPGIVCSTGKSGSERHNREIHETWNESVFLEACGIETYQITKEQILKLENGFTTDNLYKWFPEAFEVKLEVGKWYKSSSNDLYCVSGFKRAEVLAYGFEDGKWLNDGIFHISFAKKDKEATQQEVFEALKNEAVKRGFGEKCLFNFEGVRYSALFSNNFTFCNFKLRLQDGVVFENGTWATIIPIKTKEEVEKLLGVKIID